MTVTPSVGNFLLIHFPTDGGHGRAKDADAFLTRARARSCARVGAYGLPNALRMTVGDEEANRLVVAALRDFLAGAARCLNGSARRETPLVRAPRARRLRADRLLDRAAPRGAASLAGTIVAVDAGRGGAGAGARARPRRRGDEPTRRRGVARRRPRHPLRAGRRLRRGRGRRCAGALEPGAIVTDVGSVKGVGRRAGAAASAAGRALRAGHPVAGTEHSGPDAGFADAVPQPLVHPDAARGHRPGGGRAASRAFWARAGLERRDDDAAAPRPRARHHQPRAAPHRLQHRRHRRRSRGGHASRR